MASSNKKKLIAQVVTSLLAGLLALFLGVDQP
jgi:hypothetical protein